MRIFRPILSAVLVVSPAALFAQGPTGPEFQITAAAVSPLSPPAIATDAGGNSFVVWESLGGDASDYGVRGRRFDPAGGPRGAEFQVNAFITGRQSRPADVSFSPYQNMLVRGATPSRSTDLRKNSAHSISWTRLSGPRLWAIR